MKFSLAAATTLFLLPLGALASPVAAPVAAPVPVSGDSLAAAPAPVDDEMSTPTQPRAPVVTYFSTTCKIVNVSTYANCRTGPGTNYPTKFTVAGGSSYSFDCYKRGTCVDGNWYVGTSILPRAGQDLYG